MQETHTGELSTRWLSSAPGNLSRRAHVVQFVVLPTVLVPALGALAASAFGASPVLMASVVFLLAGPTVLASALVFRHREPALWHIVQWAGYAAERADDSTVPPKIPALIAQLGDAFTAEESEKELSRLEGEISGIANSDDRTALNASLAIARARVLVAQGGTDWRAPLIAAYDASGRRPWPVKPGEIFRFRVRAVGGYVVVAAIVVWIVGSVSSAHGS